METRYDFWTFGTYDIGRNSFFFGKGIRFSTLTEIMCNIMKKKRKVLVVEL